LAPRPVFGEGTMRLMASLGGDVQRCHDLNAAFAKRFARTGETKPPPIVSKLLRYVLLEDEATWGAYVGAIEDADDETLKQMLPELRRRASGKPAQGSQPHNLRFILLMALSFVGFAAVIFGLAALIRRYGL
jgi:hypothetical protein